jgi:hypothetical protein
LRNTKVPALKEQGLYDKKGERGILKGLVDLLPELPACHVGVAVFLLQFLDLNSFYKQKDPS